MRVAFDCDGTLKSYKGHLRKDVCRLLISFIYSGAHVIVWSGGGRDYARGVFSQIIREFNLMDTMPSELWENVECIMKDKSQPDLVFDDEYVTLGKTNVCIREVEETE